MLNMLKASIRAGADISKQAINISEKIVHSSGKTDLRVLNIDKEELPWKSETFDGYMAIEVLEHLFDPVHALAEMNQELRGEAERDCTKQWISSFKILPS